MFEWLEQEISAIKTPGFHSVDGPVDEKLREAIVASPLQLPFSYRQFVLKFGNARLYRNTENNSYRVGVFASPKASVLKDGTTIYHLGFHDGASVYIKPSFDAAAVPIFEYEEDEEKVATSFDEWLKESCIDARKSYNSKAWAQILNGPKPFTPEENEIIKTRQLIHWKVLGVDVKGDHIFEVMNQGQQSLPAITVGIRSKDGRLNGAVRLNTSRIGPGQKEILHVNCYKELISPEQVEAFALPDPKPEDRSYYWEFK
jgi:hypothetical protein